MSGALFMMRAVALAKRGIGLTSPNPSVGSVVVKNGKIIGVGYHHRAGDQHAEVLALRQAVRQAHGKLTGAVLYITLEPCWHVGKQPPCTDAIIASGIKKVILGMQDPFKKVNGRGIAILRKHGIHVGVLKDSSTLAKEVRQLNQPFIKWATTGLPYVVLKAAVSLDGKIATRTGESKWITGEGARDDARLERSMCDAVVVGAGTMAADNPELAPHGKFAKKKLLRVIIDGELMSGVRKKVFRDKNVLVACADSAPKKNVEKFQQTKVEVEVFGKERVSIRKLLEYLGTRDIQKVFVEGGAGVHGAFYDEAINGQRSTTNHQRTTTNEQAIVDEVIFYIAPKVIGGKHAIAAIGGEGVGRLSEVLNLKNVKTEQVGRDVKIRGVVNWY